jgi:hypothetical protein
MIVRIHIIVDSRTVERRSNMYNCINENTRKGETFGRPINVKTMS